MTNAKVHEGFRVDKKVEEHCSRENRLHKHPISHISSAVVNR